MTAVEVAKLMGHADVTTTMRVYAHVFEDCQRSQEKVLGLDYGFAVQRPCNRSSQPVDLIEG